MSSTSFVTADQLAALERHRFTALLERYGKGLRMTRDELDEIERLKERVNAPPEPAPEPETGPELVLEPTPAEVEARTLSGCRHPLTPGTPYERMYDASIRSIKRWRQDGARHDPPTMPPLDEPWRMAAWWREVKKHRVPAVLLSLEEAGPPRQAVSEPPPPEPESPSAPPPPPVAPAATGYAATLERMRQAEAIASQRYLDALNSKDEAERAKAGALRREWDEIAEQLRRYEKDAEKILQASGALWPAADVIEALHDLHSVIRDGIANLPRRIRPLLVGLSPAEQDALWEREVQKLFDGLRANKFTRAPAPDVVAA